MDEDDLLSALAVGVGALIFGGFACSIDSQKAENERNQFKLDRLKTRLERENRERTAELNRLSKLNDAHTLVLEYRQIEDAAKESKRAACSNWLAAKAHMKDLKNQRARVNAAYRRVLGALNAYIRKQGNCVGSQTRENICKARERLKELKEFQSIIHNRILSYAKVKNEVYEAKKICEEQIANIRSNDIKRKKRFFDCVSCGRKFAVMVGKLDDFYKKGYSPPKRCSDCREQRKLNMRGGCYA